MFQKHQIIRWHFYTNSDKNIEIAVLHSPARLSKIFSVLLQYYCSSKTAIGQNHPKYILISDQAELTRSGNIMTHSILICIICYQKVPSFKSYPKLATLAMSKWLVWFIKWNSILRLPKLIYAHDKCMYIVVCVSLSLSLSGRFCFLYNDWILVHLSFPDKNDSKES